ncbi:hypothetical protein LCGC14_2580450 [marine sediment metagenome]|uniref:Uncharacterized protein n=1 Tax=marine sediment metagenome TaxID=412755 RepID=A0A0F9AEH8_9ZZZZ
MPRKEPSAKLVRARRYNRANGQLKGMITQLNYLKGELPSLDYRIKSIMKDTVDNLWQIRQCIIDHQDKLIKEGK